MRREEQLRLAARRVTVTRAAYRLSLERRERFALDALRVGMDPERIAAALGVPREQVERFAEQSTERRQ